MKKLLGKKNRTNIEITFLVWLLLNFYGAQNLFFRNNIQLKDFIKYALTNKYIFVTHTVPKLLHFLFLLLIISIIAEISKNIRKKDTLHGLVIGALFLAVYIVLLISAWPGYWSWDDIYMLHDVSLYIISSWQHFISELFMMMSLMTLPFAGGLLIIQGVLAAAIVGYSASKIASLYEEKVARIVVEGAVLAVCLFPPLMEYLMSGFRMGMYSYLEMLLITKLFVLYKNRTTVAVFELVKISALTVLIASWRSEAIFYTILIPVLLFMLGKEVIGRRKVVIMAAVIFFSTIAIGKINTSLLGDDSYAITATMDQAVELVRHADASADANELQSIGKVLDIDLIQSGKGNAAYLFWYENLLKDYSKQEYRSYLAAVVKLALKYPREVVHQAWKMFADTAGINLNKNGKPVMTTAVTDALNLYNENTEASELWNAVGGNGKTPFNMELRQKVLLGIACLDADLTPQPLYYFFWNLFIPIVSVLICCLWQLLRHKMINAYLIFLTIARIPILVLASSTPYFMYYLSVYLMGYIWIIITVTDFVAEKRTLISAKN